MAKASTRWFCSSISLFALLLALTVFGTNTARAQGLRPQPSLGLPSPFADPGAWQRERERLNPSFPNHAGNYIPRPWTQTDPYGNSTTINPSVFNPGANVVIPGTSQSFGNYIPGIGYVGGTRYLGADGQPHGQTTIIDPSGRQHSLFYMSKPR